MIRSYCANCFGPKQNISDLFCTGCFTAANEAAQHFAAENPKASKSDALYAGRQALAQRGHHAHQNFVDPRTFSRVNGMLPTPPTIPGGNVPSA